MLDRRDLDIVLIAVSKEEQDKFFLKACEYDKNIYIEISQCLSPEEIQPLVDATHRMSGVVQVGCKQYDCSYKRFFVFFERVER